MNKKRKISYLIIVIFICCLCLPQLIWLIIGSRIESENNENRQLTAMPRFSLEGYGNYSKEFEDYYNDNMPFRSWLISLNRKLNYFVFLETLSDLVILGDDGWLFSTGTLADYQRNNLYTEDELEIIKNNVLNTKAYFDKRGIEFIIFVGPDKPSIYGEYMPSRYEVMDNESRTEQVIAYLRKNTDVVVIYPKDDLLLAREQYPSLQLFLKLDTHWNYMGGYFAVQPLLEHLKVDTVDFSEITYEEISEPDFLWNGYDLANVLGLADVLTADKNYKLSGYSDNVVDIKGDVTRDVGAFYGVSVSTSSSSDNRRVFLARDSFGEAMTPYLASSFSYMYSPHKSCMTKAMIEEQYPDILIYEMVERFDWKDINIAAW